MLAIPNQARTAVPQLKELHTPQHRSCEARVVCRVLAGGVVGDQRNGQPLGLRPGDLLLAVGTARVGDLCILVPRGRGRPLVGRVTHGGHVRDRPPAGRLRGLCRPPSCASPGGDRHLAGAFTPLLLQRPALKLCSRLSPTVYCFQMAPGILSLFPMQSKT